ncbi:MAG: T9SS type A sorting domain-containing protein [candidate division KSB1 bacterium]|nr:T9SS type A sorting domain-containing protein [candidate division KSB1 bacterium]
MKRFVMIFALALALESGVSPARGQDHFRPVDPSGQSYSIVITSAVMNGTSLEAGDEIGVYTSAGLCVGAVKLPPFTNIPMAAWKDNPQTSHVDGYVSGDTMRFKIWASSAQLELPATPLYQRGNGTFDNELYAVLSLSSTTTRVNDTAPSGGPMSFALQPSYPNPVPQGAKTTLRFYLPRTERVSMQIFNALGQSIRHLFDAEMPPGDHQILWDLRDAAGNQIAPGLYYYRLTTGKIDLARKLVVVR